MNTTLYIINSPWPTRIPNGSEVVKCEPREGYDGQWYKLASGENPWKDSPDPEDKDGKFKLFDNELSTQKPA